MLLWWMLNRWAQGVFLSTNFYISYLSLFSLFSRFFLSSLFSFSSLSFFFCNSTTLLFRTSTICESSFILRIILSSSFSRVFPSSSMPSFISYFKFLSNIFIYSLVSFFSSSLSWSDLLFLMFSAKTLSSCKNSTIFVFICSSKSSALLFNFSCASLACCWPFAFNFYSSSVSCWVFWRNAWSWASSLLVS